MTNFDYRYDQWKLDSPDYCSTAFVERKLVTKLGLELTVLAEFFYDKNGFRDMSRTSVFFAGDKLPFDHPLSTRYETEIDNLVHEAIEEYFKKGRVE